MYIRRCFFTPFLRVSFPRTLCGSTLFSGLIQLVYICVPIPSKAPESSKKGLLHPTIPVRYDRGKLSEVVWTLLVYIWWSLRVVSRMNKAVEHKYLLRIKTVHCWQLCTKGTKRPKVIQNGFVTSSLFQSDLTEGNYLRVLEHHQIYIW